MRREMLGAVAAMACVLAAEPARADDPHDPTMRSATARARDRAVIRQLNLRELAHVRQRDARLARRQDTASAAYHQRYAAYQRQRDRYAQDMAAWRRAVAACQAGEYRSCAR